MNLLQRIRAALNKKPKSEVPVIPKIKYGVPVRTIRLKPQEAVTVCIYFDKIRSLPDQFESYVMMWKYIYERYNEIEHVEEGCAWKLFIIDNPTRVELRMLKENINEIEINNLPILIDLKNKKN